MLIRTIPEEVVEYWDFFAPAIAKALPPLAGQTERGMVNILESILMERLDVWVYYDEDDIAFVLTTHLRYDPIVKTRNLLIYTLSGFGGMTVSMWNDAYLTLTKYAKSESCESIIAYSSNSHVIEFHRKKGAKTDYTLIELEV